ncbi:MAG: hypothetical protein QOI41_6272, partial [Myxococcales bacterium]|nr:hypothetical protein [Myxococcales bacterium]
TKAVAALPPEADAAPMLQNGKPAADRAMLPQPGDTFEIR